MVNRKPLRSIITHSSTVMSIKLNMMSLCDTQKNIFYCYAECSVDCAGSQTRYAGYGRAPFNPHLIIKDLVT